MPDIRRVVSGALGSFIKTHPESRANWLFIRVFMRLRDATVTREVRLPGNVRLACHFDSRYETMVWLEQEEREDLALLRSLLSQGDAFIDVGANVGIWSLTAATIVGDTGKVLSFEPNETTFHRLTENIELSGRRNIVSVNAAVAATNGRRSFYCAPEHNHSRLGENDESRSAQVDAFALDEYMNGDAVHGLKIDVEGGELEVLEGAARILQQNTPWVIVEYNGFYAGACALSDWPVHRLLRRYGYRPYRIGGKGRLSASPLPESWSTRHYCNLLYRVDLSGPMGGDGRAEPV